jgi:hypothetical protein
VTIKTPRTSRREFLKAGFAGIAGASILTGCSSNQKNPGNQTKDRKIVFRTLGRTGLRLPVVSSAGSVRPNVRPDSKSPDSCVPICMPLAIKDRKKPWRRCTAGIQPDWPAGTAPPAPSDALSVSISEPGLWSWPVSSRMVELDSPLQAWIIHVKLT